MLLVIDSLTPSGAERSMAALAPRYRSLGIDLTVAYLHERPQHVKEDFVRAGAELVHVDLARRGRLGTIGALTDVVRTRGFDLVHTVLFESDVLGRCAARRGRTPVVSSIVNDSYGPEHRADPAVHGAKLLGAQALDAATARLTRRLHALTGSSADVMARRLAYPRARVDVVGRGRDPQVLGRRDEHRRRRARLGLQIGDTTTILVAAARQEYQKGLDVLIHATAHLVRAGWVDQELAVVIAGRDGSQSEALRSLVTSLGVGDVVRFLGPRDDVPELLCAGDVFVVPSRREGFGSVVVEAMALEIPVVASDIPPLAEVLDGTGFLAAPEDAEALAATIERALAMPERTQTTVAAARERFLSRYTTDRVGDQMLAFYERALGTNS